MANITSVLNQSFSENVTGSRTRSSVSTGQSRHSKEPATIEWAERSLRPVAPVSRLPNGLGGRRPGERKLSLSMAGEGARSPQRPLPKFARLRGRGGRSGESNEKTGKRVERELFLLWGGRGSRVCRILWALLVDAPQELSATTVAFRFA